MGLRTKLAVLLIVTGLLSGLLSACVSESEPPVPTDQTGTTFPLEVTDQMGRPVRIERVPERIISLSPSNTEISYALGLENELVGVTEFCDYPEAAKSKPIMGGFSTVDVEKVVASQPDLILAASIHEAEVIPQLEALGLSVLGLAPKTLDEVLAAINLIGQCTGKQEAAEELVAGMSGRIEEVTDKTENLTPEERPRVFYLLWHDPLMTAGRSTGIYELIVLAGGTSIAQGLEEEYPTVGLETVVSEDPEVIVAGTGHGEGANLPYQFVLTESRLSETQARLNNRVFEIDTDLVGRPGPRMVDGLEQLSRMVHPEIFGAP